MFVPRKFRVYPQFGGQATIARQRRQIAQTGRGRDADRLIAGYASFPGFRPRPSAKTQLAPASGAAARAQRIGGFVVMPLVVRKLVAGLRKVLRASSATA